MPADPTRERRSGRDRRAGLAALLALGRRAHDVWHRRAIGCAAVLTVVALVSVVVRWLWPAAFASADRTESRALVVGGRTRTFRLHHPPGWDPEQPLPLVLVFHGHQGNARTVEYESVLDTAADRAGVLVAYPNGTGPLDRIPLLGGHWDLTWNAGTCCAPATTQHVDDVGFASAIVRELVAEGAVDPRRVYAAGFSIGGTFALMLACDEAGLVAAVADVEGTMPDTTCTPGRRVPVLLVSGSDDDELRADLRENRARNPLRFAVSMRGALRFWATRDGCTGPILRTSGATVWRDSATGCPSGLDVLLLGINGNEHAWPGGRRPYAFAPEPASGVALDDRILVFALRHARR
jgi:polyhydroxybutyrate depolymerase